MPSTVVFSEGATISIDQEAEEVARLLSKDKGNEPFTQLRAMGGVEVHVASDRVAYVQQIGAPGEAPGDAFG